ncbi:hypothetical protein QJQ45_002718 [Haematococcus lacustris]|nr:hypothetical protein QJQ45_002718 [Haematococcus lacustris]
MTDLFGLSPEQVASCRPAGYQPGLDGEAMYMILINNNHYMVLGRADGINRVLRLADPCDAHLFQRLSPDATEPRYLSTNEITAAAVRMTIEYGESKSFLICYPWTSCHLFKDDKRAVDYSKQNKPDNPYYHARGFLRLSDASTVLLPLNISNQHWVLVVVYPGLRTLVLFDSMQAKGGMLAWRWKRLQDWCTAVYGGSDWDYLKGGPAARLRVLWGPAFLTDLTIREADVASVRPRLLRTLRAASGWNTLVTPPLQYKPDLASVPPSLPDVPDPDASEVELRTEEEETSQDQVMTIADSQQDFRPEQPGVMPWSKVVDVFFTKEEQKTFPRPMTLAEQGLISEEDIAPLPASQDAAPIPCSQDAAPIPCSQLDNPLKRPREQAQQLQAPSVGEKPGQPACAGTGYFASLADDDDEALPPKPATDDESELTASEEVTHEMASLSVSSMEEEEADTLATQAEAAKGTLNTAVGAVKGRAPRVKTGKEAWAEANTPPLKPATVWRLPDFDPINPVVHDVDSEEQRIAFAREVELKGFGMMRLPERLHPSRFPKLLWALLFLVIQFAEVIFKEGTFDDEGNMTEVGKRLGTDFGTGQRLQMLVTSSEKGKVSDSAKIAGLTSPWAKSQWETMKREAGDKVELLTRRLHMAVEVATMYLSKLMPFIQKVAGVAIRGGTIIGNDPMHMRKVVYYGRADRFAYAKHPAHRTVEAQVAHVDVAPNTLNDDAALKAELDKAKHDPKAIQRHRDGMVFIIAIQTFYLLLCEDSVRWVLLTEAHAEALWGEKSTDAQKAAYATELKGMPKLYIRRVKVEAGSCVCIRGYLLHAGDIGQPDTISVRIHFYSSLGFEPGATTYVHSLSKEFCMNVMPTVQPRHGWPLVQEFDNLRNVMVPLPPYKPPEQPEYNLHYRPEWDKELPAHHIKGLEQAVSEAAAKAKAEAKKEQEEQEVQVKAAKRARSVAEPPQHFEP